MTQRELILNYLKEYGSITPLEALRHCGSMRLSERIRELVSEGHSFRKEWASSVSERTGHVSHFRKYTLL